MYLLVLSTNCTVAYILSRHRQKKKLLGPLNGLNCNFVAQNKAFIERLAHTSDLTAATAFFFPKKKQFQLQIPKFRVTQG